jgi:hypothetical protein
MHTPFIVGFPVPAVKNLTTFSTLFKMTLSSSVIVGSKALDLTGTIPKTGVGFLIPKDAATCSNCSLETASIAFTIYTIENKRDEIQKRLNYLKVHFPAFSKSLQVQ